MTESPITVSIVIPAYNAEHLVGDALASALAQIYPIREIIAVDDGSTDGTLAVLHRFEMEHPTFAASLQVGPNHGGSAARNRGLAEVTAEYVQFLDADDLLLPPKMERDVALLQAERPPLLFGLHEGVQGEEASTSRPPFEAQGTRGSATPHRFGNTRRQPVSSRRRSSRQGVG